VVTPSDNVEVATIPAGIPIAWMDTSTDGKYTFVGGGSTVKVICSSTDPTVCTGDSNSILQTITVGGALSFLKYDPHSQRVYVAGANFVSIIDASGIQSSPAVTTFTVTNITGFAGNTWVTALQDGTRFYVSDQTAHSVSVYSAANLQFIKTINLAIAAEPTTAPIMIDSDKNSTKVYTANTGSNDFSIIRTSDDTEVLPGSTGGATSGRVVPPKVASSSCADEHLNTCRQTPTYVVVLP
jgi:DNA-binding beta-propeller fold protein YncE